MPIVYDDKNNMIIKTVYPSSKFNKLFGDKL